MAFIITAPCVADYSCLEGCPAGCIHPAPDDPDFDRVEQLYVDPAACIDCGACVDLCPVDAVFAADQVPDRWRHYVDINRDYFEEPARG